MMATQNQPDGGSRGMNADNSTEHHHALVNVVSASSSHSSVHPTVFSDGSRSRSITPSSHVDSGDEAVSSGRLASSQQHDAPHKSSDLTQLTSEPSRRPEQVPASRSGHRPSWGLETIPQEAIELTDLAHPDADVRLSPLETTQNRTANNTSNGHATNTSQTTTQNDNDEVPATILRSGSIWSHTASWRPSTWPARSLVIAQRNMSVKNLYATATLTIALFAAASAAYFAFATYQLTLWQAEHDFIDYCLELEQQNHSLRPDCKDVLKGPGLAPPPHRYKAAYSWQALKEEHVVKRQREAENYWPSMPISALEKAIPITLIGVSMLLIQLGGILLWQTWREGSSQSQERPWHYRSRDHDPFARTNVRLEPVSQNNEDLDRNQRRRKSAQYRRIIPVLEKLRERHEQHEQQKQEDESIRYRGKYNSSEWTTNLGLDRRPSFDEETDAVSSIERPISSSSSTSDKAADETISHQAARYSKTPHTDSTQYVSNGDAEQGHHTPKHWSSNPTNISGGILQRFHLKRPRLPFSTDDHDIEPPLTALGAEHGTSDDNSQRQNALFSGHVAIGLSQAGAALAATAGGAIGKNILVQLSENETDRLHNMLTTGISRTRTLEEADYDLEREEFVSGEGEYPNNEAVSTSSTRHPRKPSETPNDLRRRTKAI